MRYLYFMLIFLTITVVPAFCYLDPGTGSMIVSAIIGGIAALAYVFKGFFYKLLRLFRGKKADDGSGESEE